MKKCIFTFMVSLLSVAMFAKDATISFSGKDADGNACTLSKVLVENITQNWTETLSGSSLELVMEEKGQGLEDVSVSNSALSVIGTDPFTGSTQLSLIVAQTGDVHVSLIDLSGRVIYSQNQILNAGSYIMNVNLPTAQLYYLIAETKTGVNSAKILSFGMGSNAKVSIAQGAIQRVAAKLSGDKYYYSDGDQMRFTGYSTIGGKEYSDTQTATMSAGKSRTIWFTFATPMKAKSGIFLGLIGFNNDFYYKDITYLTKATRDEFINSVIDVKLKELKEGKFKNGTLLYEADWRALDRMGAFEAPEDLSNAAIVTFTDGEDRGSYNENALFSMDDDGSRYEDSLKYRIAHEKVNDVAITSYSIGKKGSDVASKDIFEANLKTISSGDGYWYSVNNMNEVKEKFEAIADDLYKVKIISDVILSSVGYNKTTNVCWTFDIDSALNVTDWPASKVESKLYIKAELGKKSGKYYLAKIDCKGLTYDGWKKENPDTIWGEKNELLNYDFTFKNVRVTASDKAITEVVTDLKRYTRQWTWVESTSLWHKESEFSGNNMKDSEITEKSAVIMLVLDCSSSLSDADFAQLQTAAKNFIMTLATSIKDNGSGSNSGNEPSTNPNDDTVEKPESASTYYIKHSWGSGADEDWSWQPMTKDGTNYIYYGKWGGYGANINTKASNDDAKWFDAADMSGASSLSIGDGVKFTYNPTSATLSVTKTSNSSTTDRAKVRFQKQKAYDNVSSMSIEEFVNQVWVGTFVEHEFGTRAGTSTYYEIPAGKAYPMVNIDGEWYMALDEKQYHFGAGKKYTFSCGDDGTYYTYSITVDGTFNAPAKSQVVAQGRILKSELKKNAVLKK